METTNKEDSEALKKLLNSVMGNMLTLSSRSRTTMTLFQQLMMLAPVINQLDKIKDEDNLVIKQFYRSFRILFKQYEQTMSEATCMSIQDNMSDEYVCQLKDRLGTMTNGLKALYNSVVNKTQIHLLWYSFEPTSADRNISEEVISYFRKTYKQKSDFHFYEKENDFFTNLQTYAEQQNPIIIFIACNNYKQQSKALISLFLKVAEIHKNNPAFQISGVIVYVPPSQEDQENLSKQIQKPEEYKFKLTLTYDYFELYNEVFLLMNPREFRRVIPLADINLYYSKHKQDFMQLCSSKNFTNQSLFLQYHPTKIGMEEKLTQCIDLLKRKDVGVDKIIIGADVARELTKKILVCFQGANGPSDDQLIAKNLLKEYTQESYLYKFVNGCLNTLNEDVIDIIWDIIIMLRVALAKYDDSAYSGISLANNTSPTLYRGTNLAQDFFSRIIKVNEIICLASFSSFTSSFAVAEQFLLLDDNFKRERASIIFEYTHVLSTLNYEERPKAISNLGQFKAEEEYLFPPSENFKIFSITPPNDKQTHYLVKLTQGHLPRNK